MYFSDFNLRKITFSGKVLSKEEQKTIIGGLGQLRKNPGEEQDCVPQNFPYGRGRVSIGCD